MPIVDLQDCICDNVNTLVPHTVFLGATVQSFSATTGWNNDVSQLEVILYEDTCSTNKTCYSSTCSKPMVINEPDPGFYGQPRWERPDNSEYSSCTPEDGGHTLVRPALNLEGVPVYFRMGNFEWSGLISDWIMDVNSDGGRRYRVKLVDPRVVLEKTQLIIGDYSGSVFCDPACPNANLINVYGFAEYINGVPCAPYGQADPCGVAGASGVYNNIFALGNQLSVDGLAFGATYGGFGGSCWTEDGMPFSKIYQSFNYLVNAVPAVSTTLTGLENFSPYGRIVFTKVSYYDDPLNPTPANLYWGLPNDGHEYCGLLRPDTGTGCFSTVSYYFVDLSELLNVFSGVDCGGFTDPIAETYRLSGGSVSVTEMIEQMASDFGFSYYIDLVPVATPDYDTCSEVIKVIKLRIVNRRSTSAGNGEICAYIDQQGCFSRISQGRELRTDTSSRFLVGDKKHTVFQAKQNINPDQYFTIPPNNAGTLAGYDIQTGLRIENVSACPQLDDMIIPYMGIDHNGDLVKACFVNGEWAWDLPIAGIAKSLRSPIFRHTTIRIFEGEMRAALVGLDELIIYMSGSPTNPSQLRLALSHYDLEAIKGSLPLDLDNRVIGRDFASPSVKRLWNITSTLYNDITVIFQWIQKYAQEYYGQQFAVRVPFTCCWPNHDLQDARMPEQPTNEGGWTEVCEVLGLPNNNYTIGYPHDMLHFFRTEDRKIAPFVHYSGAILLDTTQLPKDSFFYHWAANAAFTLAATKGNGPPPPTGSANQVYIDLLTGMIFIANASGNFFRINELPIVIEAGSPTSPPEPTINLPDEVPFLWVNTLNGCTYIVQDYIQAQDPDTLDVTIFADSSACLTAGLYVKASVEPRYVFHDLSQCYVPRVIVKTAGPIFTRTDDKIYAMTGGQLDFDNTNVLNTGVGNAGGEDMLLAEQPPMVMINAAAIPIVHHDIRYGPWCNPSNPSWGGDLVVDEAFNPWNFGGYANMNNAGSFYACAGRTDGAGVEFGNIEVPGYPSQVLGVELGATGAGAAQYLVENRVITSNPESEFDPNGNPFAWMFYQFDFDDIWEGTFGPNITSISVSVNQDGTANTTYGFRSYTPRNNGFDRRLIDKLQESNRMNQRLRRRLARLEENIQLIQSFINRRKVPKE